MSAAQTEIRVKGKTVYVPSAQIAGRTIITNGKWLRIAGVHDEDLVEGETLTDPELFVAQLKETGINADIFTFAQRLPHTAPKYEFNVEWENFAVVPITTYAEWWKSRIESSVQRAVRKATKSGVEVRLAELDDAFVNGIVNINNETPVRQGKAFWHFQKSFEAMKHENSTYSDRNEFLGAYYQGELIGFIRMIYVDKVASIIQLLTMMKHFDKRPANALIAKAVEVCEKKGMSHLMYCNYVYNDPKSSLTEFKRRSGFEQALLPRYYIPLTLKGKIALRLGLHRGLVGQIPKPLIRQFLKARSFLYGLKLRAVKEPAQG
jgi:hypothetical protein